jgi:uncharacterized membrane protein
MLSSTNCWMCLVGLVYIVAGLIIARRDLRAARGFDKLVALGCVFIAAPLAVFATEHFRGARFIMNLVPAWMPARLFWAYFVGCALIAAATSLIAQKLVRLSSSLLGLMWLIFVLTLHLPNVATHPKDRIMWAIALRDLSFSGGVWALAGVHTQKSSPEKSRWMILYGRIVVAIAVIFFAVEHFLHPEFAPGVPLQKITPTWFPLAIAWGYIAGAILLAAGIALLINRRPRMAATSIGTLMTVLTLFLYLPILIMAHGGTTPLITEGINYVADTLLFAGAAFVLASALPKHLNFATVTTKIVK